MNQLSPQQTYEALQYELKINEMGLIPTEKQSLTECLANIIGIQTNKLHEIICDSIQTALSNDNLPRKLESIRKDLTIVDEYKRNPNLFSFSKITLEIVSQLYQTKVTVYSLSARKILVGLIINEKGYQQNLKIARINNSYYEIKDCSYSNISSKSLGGVSNNSYQLFEAFQIDVPKSLHSAVDNLSKSHQSKQSQYPKTLTQLPAVSLLSKCVSSIENYEKFNNVEPANKSFDEVSIENHQSLDNDRMSLSSQQDASVGQSYQKIDEEGGIDSEVEDPNAQMYYYAHLQPNNNFYQPYMYRQSPQKNEGYMNYSSMSHLPAKFISPSKNVPLRRQNTKPMEIDCNERYTGRLKFFDEAKNYGFIIMDADLRDIFVHCDDLLKAGISKQRVKAYKQSESLIRFSFKVMSYFGKYKQSRKAVQLQIIEDSLNMPAEW